MNESQLPLEVIQRIKLGEKGRINVNQELIIESQQERSQHKNRTIAMEKLQEIINKNWETPKPRDAIDQTPSEFVKQQWKEEKREKHKIKQLRRAKIDYNFDY